ncbi:PDR/VanB family oxidoreductase [Pseudonocardia sp. NPDC046786]|uniref:PDR/VanB family oxidoreductase n=1 Tax=Pseudonocardia sp. NPDC046786 TaxID=3155471 RepID=UPI0033E42B75
MQQADGATLIPGESAIAATVRDKVLVADGVVLLSLESESGGALPPWLPGAHVDLVLGPSLVRQYSLCGDPEDLSCYQVAVLREPDGRGGSAFIHDWLAPGSSVEVHGPRNHFALVDAEEYLFIAGGIGITPMLPMIGAVAARGAPWRLVYGGRSRTSMAFGGDLSHRHPDRVTVLPHDEAGLLPLAELLPGPTAGQAVYCCGPSALLEAVEDRCRSWPQGVLHVERFAPKQVDPTGPDKAFTVELALSGRTLVIPPEGNLLDALMAEGVDVVMSCHEGTCGTCMTTVLGGVPDHRDSVLTERERAANNVLLPCVSRCMSDTLILDL